MQCCAIGHMPRGKIIVYLYICLRFILLLSLFVIRFYLQTCVVGHLWVQPRIFHMSSFFSSHLCLHVSMSDMWEGLTSCHGLMGHCHIGLPHKNRSMYIIIQQGFLVKVSTAGQGISLGHIQWTTDHLVPLQLSTLLVFNETLVFVLIFTRLVKGLA